MAMSTEQSKHQNKKPIYIFVWFLHTSITLINRQYWRKSTSTPPSPNPVNFCCLIWSALTTNNSFSRPFLTLIFTVHYETAINNAIHENCYLLDDAYCTELCVFRVYRPAQIFHTYGNVRVKAFKILTYPQH